MKRILVITICLLIFCGLAAILAYWVLQNFHPFCQGYSSAGYENWNRIFAEKEYSELKDLGKSFLTLLVGVFVASITFSEKIVSVSTTTFWSKSMLYLCWLF